MSKIKEFLKKIFMRKIVIEIELQNIDEKKLYFRREQIEETKKLLLNSYKIFLQRGQYEIAEEIKELYQGYIDGYENYLKELDKKG